MKSGNLSTAKRDREVKALAGVRYPPSRVYAPNDTTVTTTGMPFNIKVFHWYKKNIYSTVSISNYSYRHHRGVKLS